MVIHFTLDELRLIVYALDILPVPLVDKDKHQIAHLIDRISYHLSVSVEDETEPADGHVYRDFL